MSTALFVDPAATVPVIGDFFVCDVGGFGGVGIAVGQVLDGDPARWLAWNLGGRRLIGGVFPPPWLYEHTGIYIGNDTVVQAEPGGTQYRTLSSWGFTRRVLWSTGAFTLTDQQRRRICAAARGCAERKVPYSPEDYGEIALHRLGVKTDWLREEIKDSGHMICSQETDWCYQQAPYKLFNDGRWYGDVTPMDLATLLINRGSEMRGK